MVRETHTYDPVTKTMVPIEPRVYVKRGRPSKWNFATFAVGEARVYPQTQAVMARSAMYKHAARCHLVFESRTLVNGSVEIKRLK